MRGRSDAQTSQNVRCVLNKLHTRRRTATNFWLFWPTAWWMTAVSSSLMQETSTTPQRSSEVSAPVPSSLPRLPDIIVCLCLLGLCLRDPAQCVMLCSCGDSHNISSERTSIRAACPLTMLMQCVCVYPCACTVCAGSCRESALMLFPLKSCFLNRRPRDVSAGELLLLLAPAGSGTHDPQFSGSGVYVSGGRTWSPCVRL